MASQKLLDMLNKAIAMEMQAAIQYMWQHVAWRGVKGFAVKDELRKIAVEEMKHAEAIAERLSYLGGKPTTEPAPARVGETLKEMIENDRGLEEETIKFYKEIIRAAGEEGDEVTHRLFRQILADEEEHHDFFRSLLEEI